MSVELMGFDFNVGSMDYGMDSFGRVSRIALLRRALSRGLLVSVSHLY